MSGEDDKIIRPHDTFEDNKIQLPKNVEASTKGVVGDASIEKNNKKFYRLKNEKVLSNPDGGAHIVLGRDRTSILMNETVGLPSTNSIDIIVGRLGKVSKKINKEKQKSWISPDFLNDSARIHISQFTNIDKNFRLPKGKFGISENESGIGIKADSLRFISRTGAIKLVSAHDKKDSNGLLKEEIKGTELIAGIPGQTRNDMQAIPKTENLKKAFEELLNHLNTITAVLINFSNQQLAFNEYLVYHTHLETFQGNQGIPSKDVYGPYLELTLSFWETTLQDIKNFKAIEIPKFQATFLNEKSDLYIGSRFHFLN